MQKKLSLPLTSGIFLSGSYAGLSMWEFKCAASLLKLKQEMKKKNCYLLSDLIVKTDKHRKTTSRILLEIHIV